MPDYASSLNKMNESFQTPPTFCLISSTRPSKTSSGFIIATEYLTVSSGKGKKQCASEYTHQNYASSLQDVRLTVEHWKVIQTDPGT